MCEMIDLDNEWSAALLGNGLLIRFNSIHLYFTLYKIFTQVYVGRKIK